MNLSFKPIRDIWKKLTNTVETLSAQGTIETAQTSLDLAKQGQVIEQNIINLELGGPGLDLGSTIHKFNPESAKGKTIIKEAQVQLDKAQKGMNALESDILHKAEL